MRYPINEPDPSESRPWYREPWPWVLIALPLLTIIASAVTFWLAVSHPDYLVLEGPEYLQVKSQLQAEPTAEARPAAQAVDEPDGDR